MAYFFNFYPLCNQDTINPELLNNEEEHETTPTDNDLKTYIPQIINPILYTKFEAFNKLNSTEYFILETFPKGGYLFEDEPLTLLTFSINFGDLECFNKFFEFPYGKFVQVYAFVPTKTDGSIVFQAIEKDSQYEGFVICDSVDLIIQALAQTNTKQGEKLLTLCDKDENGIFKPKHGADTETEFLINDIFYKNPNKLTPDPIDDKDFNNYKEKTLQALKNMGVNFPTELDKELYFD